MSCPCLNSCIEAKCLQTPTYCNYGSTIIVGELSGYDRPINIYIESLSVGTVILIETEVVNGVVQFETEEGMINGSDSFILWLTEYGETNALPFTIGEVDDISCLKLNFKDTWLNGFRYCEPIQEIAL